MQRGSSFWPFQCFNCGLTKDGSKLAGKLAGKKICTSCWPYLNKEAVHSIVAFDTTRQRG